MKKEVVINGLTFQHFIDAETIKSKVKEIAKEISKDYENRDPIFVVVMNGAFVFAADLLRRVKIDCDIKFVQVKSYIGLDNMTEAEIIWPYDAVIDGRDVVIIEDVVDTGSTLNQLIPFLKSKGSKSIVTTAIFIKPHAHTFDVSVAYPGINISDEFIIGYGLDYNGLGRNLKDIYQLKPLP